MNSSEPSEWRRLANYEWHRLVATRGTWGVLAVAILSAGAAIGSLAVTKTVGVDPTTAHTTWVDSITSPVSVTSIAAGVLGATIGGQELRWNALRDTLIRVGKRGRFLTVKSASAALGGGLACVLAVVCGLVAARIFNGDYAGRLHHDAALSTLDDLWLIGRVFTVGVFSALVGVFVSFATKSVQWGIALPIIIGNVIEPLLAAVFGRGSGLLHLLPYQNARAFLTGGDQSMTGLSPTAALTAMLITLLCLAALGSWRMTRHEF